MKQITWFFKLLLKVVIFIVFFAFALNNQNDVTVHFLFGQQWNAPLVLVILTAFAAGLLIGILGMVPRWWNQKRAAMKAHHARGMPDGQFSNETSTTSSAPLNGL